MAVQRGPIDGAVLNGASLTVVFAAAAMAAAGSVAAPAFRNTPITATPTGVASIPSNNLWQVHSAHVNGQAVATIYAYSSVNKHGAASLDANAVLYARQAPVPGGSTLDGTSSLVADATQVQQAVSSGVSGATASAEAYRWVFAGASCDSTCALAAEPGVKLNGQSFWTFEAYAQEIGFGSIGFVADGIRIIPHDSVFAGFAGVQAPATYTHRVTSTAPSSLTVVANAGQTHQVASSFSAAGSVQADATRYAKVSSSGSATASFTSTGYAHFLVDKNLQATSGCTASGTRYVFHGYPVLSASASISCAPWVFFSATAEPMGFATATLDASVNIRALDVINVIRPYETRDYLRSPETRDFLRSAT